MTKGRLIQQNTTRHETLALLRLVAIIGQAGALFVSWQFINIDMNYSLAAFIVLAWLGITIVQMTMLGRDYRLPTFAIFTLLVIDLLELAFLLFIAGGLNNPFAILLIVPVVLGANALDLQYVIILAGMMFAALMINYGFAPHLVLDTVPLSAHPILRFGFMGAIVISMLFLSFFARRMTQENLIMTRALAASELALQREHRLSSLGGLVAAYAHELGTPLASIRLIADDVLEEKLGKQTKADIAQIKSEAARCAQILADMGRIGKDDALIKTVPFSALVEEAAAPHRSRGKAIDIYESGTAKMPMVQKSSAIIHGLRNIIQNAVDFADKRVDVEIMIKPQKVILRVSDDGDGYAPDIAHKIGEPYIHSKSAAKREGYEGMGLGLFISKTLIETTGGKMSFANKPKHQGKGAIVTIIWKMRDIEVSKTNTRAALGDNQEQVL